MKPRTLELFEILTTPRDENTVVAWQLDGTKIPLRVFRNAVARLGEQLRRCPQERRALCFNDAGLMAVAFFAAAFAQKQIVIPGHTRAEQLRGQSGFFDGVLTDDPTFRIDVPILTLSSFEETGENRLPVPPEDEFFAGVTREQFNAVTVTFFTSGSTGTPKPNTKKIRQLEIENKIQAERWAGKIDGAHIAGTTSHLHLYGLQFRVLLPLSRGVPFNTTLIEYHEQLHAAPRPLALISSPAFLKRLDKNLPPLCCSFVLSAGGFLPEQVAVEAAQILGVSVLEIFGSTEAGAIAWRDNAREKNWTPLPCVKISADADGRLHLQSPFLSDSETLATDDRICLAGDGLTFELLGRLDRTIKIEEKRIALPEVEKRLLEDAHIVDAAVVPLKTETRTILGAILVLNDEGRRQFSEQGSGKYLLSLRARLRQKLEPVAVPRRIRVTAHIPANTQGKRNTADLRAMFSASESPAGASKSKAPGVDLFPAEIVFSAGGNEARLTFRLQPELVWFDGHFEKHAILPGVTQLHWACKYAADFFPVLGNFHRVETVKFKKPLKPNDNVVLELRHHPERNATAFTYLAPDGSVASSGKIIFAP